ncbi:hypothetical protein A3B19_01815 [Candidatus Giovannonibacteria bacterium RIFCSPLOWO2_01_FULL_46_32]|uniref:Uncharacterized protein n=1 Tax=Candidatus Giovannonibacteria bacterium RIFCSPLOWO2_01_FULL_46_32 TaxID=1798353 RepID=A0A1F5XGS9_9BACT|nr:MAG: hypothetical protein A3B19_01815 [Candidatus Giovannonibacteria bacterium RIFCSPLOWO2_01_FULL_46_32]
MQERREEFSYEVMKKHTAKIIFIFTLVICPIFFRVFFPFSLGTLSGLFISVLVLSFMFWEAFYKPKLEYMLTFGGIMFSILFFAIQIERSQQTIQNTIQSANISNCGVIENSLVNFSPQPGNIFFVEKLESAIYI